MYADDWKGYLPPSRYAPRMPGQGEAHNTLVARIAGSRPGWDGLGLLFSNEYVSDPRVFYCPSHTGLHPFARYTADWTSDAPAEIVTNYQYRATDATGRPLSLFDRTGRAMLADGLRTQADYNHPAGVNVLASDMAVMFVLDSDRRILSNLPLSESDHLASAKVVNVWELIDSELPGKTSTGQPSASLYPN